MNCISGWWSPRSRYPRRPPQGRTRSNADGSFLSLVVYIVEQASQSHWWHQLLDWTETSWPDKP
jgi:hypothetical protein